MQWLSAGHFMVSQGSAHQPVTLDWLGAHTTPFVAKCTHTKALQEAEAAYEKGEIPVGAVIVVEDRIIARAHNLTEQLNDVTAHAEMQAIT